VKKDYSRDQLASSIREVGIQAGDTVSLQVSLGRLGMPDGPSNYEGIADLVIDTFFDVLGPAGTLVVPAYTYSLGRGLVFDVESTPSAIGQFPDIFRRRKDVLRSRDPMLSTAAKGPGAADIVRNLPQSCYGVGSVFERLRRFNAKICTLGIGLHWATFRHHIEEMAGVPFRFCKPFRGVVREQGVDSEEVWMYFAAPRGVEACLPDGRRLEKILRSLGVLRIAKIGRSEVMAIGAREYFDYGLERLREDNWLTAKGPKTDVATIIARELHDALSDTEPL
jgi:aminoglycoside 3-N-acetyltransferase